MSPAFFIFGRLHNAGTVSVVQKDKKIFREKLCFCKLCRENDNLRRKRHKEKLF